MSKDKYGHEKGSPASIKAWADRKREGAQLSSEDKHAIREEAASRDPSLTRRMIQHDASERAERGEPYNERDGG